MSSSSVTPIIDRINADWPKSDDPKNHTADRGRYELFRRTYSLDYSLWRTVPRPVRVSDWKSLDPTVHHAGVFVSNWLDDVRLAEFDGDWPSQQPKGDPGSVPVSAILVLVEDALARGESVNEELVDACKPYVKSAGMMSGVWAKSNEPQGKQVRRRRAKEEA